MPHYAAGSSASACPQRISIPMPHARAAVLRRRHFTRCSSRARPTSVRGSSSGCTRTAFAGRSARCAASASCGTAGGCRSSSITSTATPRTTVSGTSGSCVRTARRRWRPTAAGTRGSSASRSPVRDAVGRSRLARRGSAIARGTAARGGIAIRTGRLRGGVGRARPTSACSPRSAPTATPPSAGGTASRTTPSASGSARTSGSSWPPAAGGQSFSCMKNTRSPGRLEE